MQKLFVSGIVFVLCMLGWGDSALGETVPAPYPFDPGKARQLVREAGYPDG